MKKLGKALLIFVTLLITATSVFAGKLGRDDNGIYYQHDNGCYAYNEWVELDLDGDSYLEYYYFDADGYLVTDSITDDGYQVNKNGQWIKDGKIQKKKTENTNSNKEAFKSNKIKTKKSNTNINNNSSNNSSSSNTVWISGKGKKYHKNSYCSGMKDPREVTVAEAEAMGRGPCKKCYK